MHVLKHNICLLLHKTDAQCTRSGGDQGPSRAKPRAALTCDLDSHARDLHVAQSFSYGFSGRPRCNPLEQTDVFLYHTQAQPKRTHLFKDMNENHQIRIYSFGWYWPALFPASIIVLVPV